MAEPKKPVDPQKEIEILIGELEERVDRLRAMYEQYFMGYEKIEPGVARKDVDRRFTVLRKTQIRNTALRFRFNVVTQKMNTYAMYWTRVCRQIEEGTFKRHIQKANRRFGRGGREQDFSIDVELGDFDDMMDADGELDMDGILADAEAAAAAAPTRLHEKPEIDETMKSALGYERDDTAKNKLESLVTEVPPPKSIPKPARTPVFAPPEQDNADTLPPPSTGNPHTPNRVARHAQLPTGLKQRVLLKKGAPSQPGSVSESATSTKTEPAPPSSPEMTPAPMAAPGMRGRLPSTPDRAPPSTSVIRAAAPGSQGHVHRSPPGVHRPAISPNAHSVQRVHVAKRASDTSPPPSVQARAAQPPPSTNRIPAQPAPPPASTNRIPIPPSQGRMPIGLPSGGSIGRMPVSAGTIPPPTTRPAAPPPSERKLPVPPPSQRSIAARPGGPMPAAAPVRAPAPSVPDVEKGGPPSRRPPPPLPSQVKKG